MAETSPFCSEALKSVSTLAESHTTDLSNSWQIGGTDRRDSDVTTEQADPPRLMDAPGSARPRDRRNLRDGVAYDRFKELAELPLLLAALAVIPILAAPYIFDISDRVDEALTAAAWFIWAMFVVEYVTLFTLAPNRWRMFRTHIFDLLIIVLPFLRPLRAARSARLLRLLTISGRIGIGFKAIAGRKGVRVFGLVVILVVAVGALLT